MRRTFMLFAVLATTAVAFADGAIWDIDPARSKIEFTIRHMVVSKATGSFHKFSGGVVGDPNDPVAARIEVTIDPASIDTGNSDRDRDLRSPNFFDVEKYTAILFKSKRIDKAADGALTVAGELAMHGVTKEVILAVDQFAGAGPGRMRVIAKSRLNRKDFGIVWNKTLDGGGLALADEVNIRIAVELVKRELSSLPLSRLVIMEQ